MAQFKYVALDAYGKKNQGVIDADDEKDAKAAVRALKLTPLKITSMTGLNGDIDIHFGKKVATRDLSVFCNQAVSMLNAGIPVVDTLDMLSEQTENRYMKEALVECKESIEQGDSFGVAMKKRKDIFPPMLISMVEAGEASGSLEVALGRMAQQFEKDAKLAGMVKKAMVYPIIVVIVAIAVVIVMLTSVVPTFMSMFADMDIAMPKLTLMVMGASDWMQHHVVLILVVVAAVYIGFTAFKRSEFGKYFLGGLALKIPAIRNFVEKSNASRFARTMSTLTAAGVGMPDALEITSNTMSNVLFRDALMTTRDEIMKGTPLSVPLRASGLFPDMVTHMAKIGEETGKLEEMLNKMADYYDEEVEVATQALLTAMEPVIILVLALIVGVLIGAVMMPMLSLYNGLDNI